MMGSLIISAALTSAAEARNSTLLPWSGSVFGVAVNSTMQDGRNAAQHVERGRSGLVGLVHDHQRMVHGHEIDKDNLIRPSSKWSVSASYQEYGAK